MTIKPVTENIKMVDYIGLKTGNEGKMEQELLAKKVKWSDHDTVSSDE